MGQPVALPLKNKKMAVVYQPVNDRTGQLFIIKNTIPFAEFKEITDWAEMMGDPVLTTALLDRILHHAKCFSFRGESYRLKHPELFT